MDPLHDSLGNCDAADAFRYLSTVSEMVKTELYESDMNDYVENKDPRRDVGTTGY